MLLQILQSLRDLSNLRFLVRNWYRYWRHHRSLRLHPPVHLRLLHRRNLLLPQGPEEKPRADGSPDGYHVMSQDTTEPQMLLERLEPFLPLY